MSAHQYVQAGMQQRYGLRVLRIHMERTRRNLPIAVFTLSLGGETLDTVAMLTASLDELGFSRAAHDTPECAAPQHFEVPHQVAAAVAIWCSDIRATGEPLWLSLSHPLGLLPMVPWEALLQPHAGVPILRLPEQALCPVVPQAGVRTLVCFSAPEEVPGLPDRIAGFFASVPPELARTTQFHLFGDSTLYPHLVDLQRRYAGSLKLYVYDPAHAPGSDSLTDPWLTWMENEMGEGSADMVHFLCNGQYLQPDHGALRLAGPPGGGASDRTSLLAAPELISFLNFIGAWGVAFSSTDNAACAAGLRLLQGEVAQFRPGPALVHDMNEESSREAIGQAYRFLFTPAAPPPASPAISMYCHPQLLYGNASDEESAQQLQQFTLEGRLGEALHASAAPAWLAHSQRQLEATAGGLADAVATGRGQGRARARAFVLDAIARQGAKNRSKR